ncbi:MAG TPA: hypothetical protein VKI44_01825 [Acetobacteraceae bacterium]|nr:hypothetical protein [Acetobacteraceae bacterium]
MNTGGGSRVLGLRRTASVLQAALLLLSVAIRGSYAENYQQLHLSLTGIDQEANETVSAIYLQITGGLVVSFPRVPVGWTITIDNDPSWSAQISAIAIVGAANLAFDELESDWLVIQRMPAALQAYPGAPQRVGVNGYLELYKSDRSRRVQLSDRNFVLTR